MKPLKDIVDDRPYGVVVEIDKPEDCTLSIQNLSDPVLVTSEMSDDVGAILVDPATETDEVYILPRGTGKKINVGNFETPKIQHIYAITNFKISEFSLNIPFDILKIPGFSLNMKI